MMIQFNPITLDDQSLFDKYFTAKSYCSSECNFTHLYIWRKPYHVEWSLIENFLVIYASAGDEHWILPPFGDYEHGDVKTLFSKLNAFFESKHLPFIIHGITEPFKEVLQQHYPENFEFEDCRDMADYVYDGNNLRTLAGRKYHGKRNHLNNFKKNYPDYSYETFTPLMIDEVKAFLTLWYDQKKERSLVTDDLIYEQEGLLDALLHYDRLHYKAAVIRINGKIEAFTMGELLNPEMLVVHMEKANSDINGLYPAINYEFLNHEWQDVSYVNREEDTGDEGLRKSKLSYNPIKLVSKYKGVFSYD